MRRINTLLLTLVVALSASSAFAGVLNGDGSAYAGWTGSTGFTGPWLPNPPGADIRLEGYIDWAVYAPGTFPGAFTANVPIPLDQYVYAYQAFVTGEPPLSQLSVTLATDAFNIGSFTGTPDDGTAYPTTFEEILPTTAIWYFINQTVPTGSNSYGLVFTSPYAPMLSTGRTIDDGSQAIVLPVPSPTPPPAPEPATWILAAFGLAGLGFQVFRRRGQRKNS